MIRVFDTTMWQNPTCYENIQKAKVERKTSIYPQRFLNKKRNCAAFEHCRGDYEETKFSIRIKYYCMIWVCAAAAASKNKNNKNSDYNDKENNSSLNKSGLLDNEVCILKIKDWKGFQFYSLRNKRLVHKKYSTFTDFQMGRQNIGHNF